MAAAHSSRCAVGLLEWPKIPCATRAMVVLDPAPKNSFVPRSTPATVFGPSSRVPGGYIVFHQGRLREVVNLQISSMTAEEVAVVKGTMKLHEPPFALMTPPTSESWDARKVSKMGSQTRDGGWRIIQEEQPDEEAPRREETAEDLRITVNEVLDMVEPEVEREEASRAARTQAATAGISPSRKRRRQDGRTLNCVYPHALMTLAEDISETGATHGSSRWSEELQTTEGRSETETLWSDDDTYTTGLQLGGRPASAELAEEHQQRHAEDDPRAADDIRPAEET